MPSLIRLKNGLDRLRNKKARRILSPKLKSSVVFQSFVCSKMSYFLLNLLKVAKRQPSYSKKLYIHKILAFWSDFLHMDHHMCNAWYRRFFRHYWNVVWKKIYSTKRFKELIVKIKLLELKSCFRDIVNLWTWDQISGPSNLTKST